MDGAFLRLANRRHFFNTVIDIGASNGSWSGSLMKYFPLCQYLLIEAQPVHAEALREFSKDHNNVHVVLAVAGKVLVKSSLIPPTHLADKPRIRRMHQTTSNFLSPL
jgi:FkbM family methyltransferase